MWRRTAAQVRSGMNPDGQAETAEEALCRLAVGAFELAVGTVV
jgi:hypothetical protein